MTPQLQANEDPDLPAGHDWYLTAHIAGYELVSRRMMSKDEALAAVAAAQRGSDD